MRWFTREWHEELSDEEVDARTRAYTDYVTSVANRLPQQIRDLALPATIHMSVHDALVDRAQVDTLGRVAELVLLNGDLQAGYGKLHMEFIDTDLIEPPLDRLRELLGDPETEFLDQEVEVIEGQPVVFEIRFLLWPEGQIAIRCTDARITWTAITDTTRSDHRNEVVIRR